ncbi:MAG: META domain-containing protein [Chitinophagaceae bacterium]|nr:MAG: META domain-containing protein [Chitinophagaceae bacterium]
MKQLIVMLAGLAILAACGSGSAESNNLPDRDTNANASAADTSAVVLESPSTQDTMKLDGTWYLVATLPSDTATGKVPYISFDIGGKTFTGNTGCNSMRGSFTYNDSTIQINEQIITTKMACVGYNEEAFLKNLPRTNKHRFESGMLILLNEGTELSRWSRTKGNPRILKTT